MIDQHVSTRPVEEDTTAADAAPQGKRGSKERTAVWSLWALIHWAVFSAITLSVIYLVVLLQ